MVLIRESDGKWTCEVTAVKLPLREGAKIRVDAAVLGRAEDVVCRLEGWEYHVLQGPSSRVLQLELTVVEEKKPGWIATELNRLYARLPPDDQMIAPMMTALLALFLLGGPILLLYQQPFHGLAFAGRHIRSVVDCVILVLFVFVLPKQLGLLNRPQSFRKNFYFMVTILAGLALYGMWQSFSALPAKFGGMDEDWANYFRGLGTDLSRSYWPLVVAALPWFSIGFKIFGLRFAEKTSEKLESVAKKGKE